MATSGCTISARLWWGGASKRQVLPQLRPDPLGIAMVWKHYHTYDLGIPNGLWRSRRTINVAAPHYVLQLHQPQGSLAASFAFWFPPVPDILIATGDATLPMVRSHICLNSVQD
jgi:hypothetical protein